MDFKKEELVKSPLNYTGGKFKLLPQLLPLFPNKINNFIDLFCGGCNVGINIKANQIICNDYEKVIIDLYNDLKALNSKTALDILKSTIDEYQLSKTNEGGFKKIREDYNKGNKSWNMFYAMITNSFNYDIRFNKNGEYNVAFGRNRSSFNPTLEKNFVKFVDRINELNIDFVNNNFIDLKIDNLGAEDFVYCDPPYLITCANYNENGGWDKNKEIELLNLLDSLNYKGVKFALSNVLENKGKTNNILKEWAKDYNIHYLNNSYGNCNYHTKDKSNNSTIEVLITNY